MYGFFFKSVFQSVCLFGAEMWVFTPPTGRVLGGFQEQVEWQLTGRLLRQRSDRRWEYTLADTAREEAGFEPMEIYIQTRQNTVAQYIATRPIMDLCEVVDRKHEARVGIRWWKQAGIDLGGTRDMATTAAEENKDGLE